MRKNSREHKVKKNSKGKLGLSIGLLDKNNLELKVGDRICYGTYNGILLYNSFSEEYGIALDYSQWYGESKYDIKSYGKFISIPMDNGAKLELKRLEAY